jgi:hypothetical protein
MIWVMFSSAISQTRQPAEVEMLGNEPMFYSVWNVQMLLGLQSVADIQQHTYSHHKTHKHTLYQHRKT